MAVKVSWNNYKGHQNN